MSIITVIWSGAAAAVLTFGIIHFAVWIQNPKATANLLFSIIAFSVASFVPAELGMMHAVNAAEWAAWIRWIHLPVFGVLVGGILFVWIYLGTGRPWLMWAFIAIRTVILIWNFLFPVGFTFQEVISIRQIPFLGELVSVREKAVVNPWQWIALGSLLLFMLFIADAVISSWRRGTEDQKRKAIVVVGTMAVSFLLIFVQSQMVFFGLMLLPWVLTPAFIIMVGGMAYELGRDILRAKHLAGALHESEEHLHQSEERLHQREERLHESEERLHESEGLLHESEERFHESEGRLHESEGRLHESEGRLDLAQKQTHVELDRLRRELAHAGRVTMLGQLTSTLAHEIKQPLGAILMNSDVVRILLQSDTPDFKLLRDAAGDIRKDAVRMNQVIDRLSALLKRRSMETRAIPTRELVEDVIALAQSEAVARHIALESTIAPDIPPVRGDRVHLSQVLLNLIINAMDAAEGLPDDRRRIAIEAHPQMDHMAEITVADFGAGLAPDLGDKVFEPFFTTKPEGMGMGLAISRTIVEAHGGQLWAANNTNLGATFHLLLPIEH